MVATLSAITLLVPFLPSGPTAARAQDVPPTVPDQSDQQPGGAIWRVRAQSWLDSWAGDQPLHAVDFVDQARGFAVLGKDFSGRPSLLETRDGGDSWTVVHRALWFDNNAVGTRTGAEFLKADDGTLIGVAFATDQDQDRTGIYVTRDRQNPGRSWSLTTTRSFDRNDETVMDFSFTTTDGQNIVGVGRGGTRFNKEGAVLRSTDGGSSWTEDQRGNQHLNAVAFVLSPEPQSARGVAVGEAGSIFYTTDGGENWDPGVVVDSAGETVEVGVALADVAIVDDRDDAGAGDLTAVAVGADGTVLSSTDGGATWTQFMVDAGSGLPASLEGVALADSNPDEQGDAVGYIVGGVETAPVVLEMQDGNPSDWAPAPVDPRFAAMGPAVLRDVNVDPSGTTAMAVGGPLMLERTPASNAERITDDDWWRCAPRGLTGDETVDGTVEQTVDEQAPENDDDPGVRLCRERPEDTTPRTSDPDALGPTPAREPCAGLAQDELEAFVGGDARFPCLATWQPATEQLGPDGGRRPGSLGSVGTAFLDEDMAGEGRRLVAVDAQRIFLFDPDRLEQRGVPGFGVGWDGLSVAGERTGVVNLGDAPEGFPRDHSFGGSADRIAYDDGERAGGPDQAGAAVYLGSNTSGGTLGSTLDVPPVIAAVSLTGEFDPTHIELPPLLDPDAPGRTNAALLDLTFDSRFGMLYARTATNYRQGKIFGAPTMADDTQVTLHAIATRVDAGELELTRAWSLSLEDHGCHSGIGATGLAVDGTGDALSFACTGHAGPHFGIPNFEANRIVTVRLRLRGETDHPEDLDPNRVGDVAVHSELIAGKVINEDHTVFEIPDRGVLAWNQTAEGTNLWSFADGGWIGTVPFPDIRGLAGFGMEGEHDWRGRMYASCIGSLAGEDGCVRFGTGADARDEPAVLIVDSLNVPAQTPAGVTEKVRLPRGPGFPPDDSFSHTLVAVPPRDATERPRLFMRDANGLMHLFEDRAPPVLERVSPDPDDRTFPDVDKADAGEADAGDVKRIGRASGYGARLWWTGLGSASAFGCQQFVGDDTSLVAPCGSPTLSYDWWTDKEASSVAGIVPHGRHTSAIPGLPAGGTREMRLGEVQKANLENNKSGRLSDARAVGLFYDGGPADDSKGSTGEDLSRRRGADPHLFFDSEVDTLADEFCSRAGDNEEQCRDEYENFNEARHGDPDEPEDEGFEGQFGPYEASFEEFFDRGMREIDGERRIEGGCREERPFNQTAQEDDPKTAWNEEDCLYQFDQQDRRCGRDNPETENVDESSCFIDEEGNETDDERGSVFGRAEVVLASECSEPASKDEDFVASRTTCRIGDFGRTYARGELNAFELATKEASAAEGALKGLSIGATGSDSEIFRDAKQGIVVETVAWAADIELKVEGRGSLQIGEVRSVGRAWAHGRDGTADSTLDVAFQNVVITSPSGEERFSCGRSRAGVDRLSGDPDDLPSDDECDPHEVVDAISDAFAGKVQATTSARDTDPKVKGSPGGAQAMVRRDPVDVLSDQVINRIQRHFELPALQLTIYNDSLRPNRMQIDLAAVYAETHYEIGLPAPEFPALPGAVDVSLSDFSGNALAGGEFALLEDADGDGALSGGDAPVGSCATGGAGTCSFEALDAGAYLVEQRSAPPGFLPEDAPRGVFVSDGSRASAEFVNGPDGAGVVVELVDPQGTPLAGGEFALVQDPDGDGAVEPSDAVAGGCVTGETGTCRFDRVSLGPWVLHQAAAPGGYQNAGDVAFALQRAGQVAEIRVVNGPAVAGATVRIVEIIGGAEPASNSPGGDAPWWALLPKGLAALLLRNWIQALLFALTGALFGTPAYLAHRRRELGIATHRR